MTVRRKDGSLGTGAARTSTGPREGYVIDAPAAADAVVGRRASGRSATPTPSTCAPSTRSWRWARPPTSATCCAGRTRAAGMPWVNTTAADRNGDVLYADHSVVPNVPDDLAAAVHDRDRPGAEPGRRAARASTAPAPVRRCAWRHRPRRARAAGSSAPATCRTRSAATGSPTPTTPTGCPTPTSRLEGYAGIIGCERCERTMRTRMVYRYVQDRLTRRRQGVAGERCAATSTRTG